MKENLESIGGLGIHKKAVFKDDLSIERKCNNCENTYQIKKNENHLAKEKNIFLDTSTIKENVGGLLGGDVDLMKSEYEGVIQHIGVCPHCNYSEELFCESTGKTFGHEFEREYNFF